MSLKALSLSLFVLLCVCSPLCGGGTRGEEEKAEKKKKKEEVPCPSEAPVRGRSLPALLWLGRGLQLSRHRQQSPLSDSAERRRRDSCGEAQSSGLVRKGAPSPRSPLGGGQSPALPHCHCRWRSRGRRDKGSDGEILLPRNPGLDTASAKGDPLQRGL